MKKQHWFVIGGGVVLLALILIYGKTVNPNKKVEKPVAESKIPKFDFDSAMIKIKNSLEKRKQIQIAALENEAKTGTNTEKIAALSHLSLYWKDSLHFMEPYLFYNAEAAKLDNSEKTLTFAAQMLIDNMLELGEPSEQNWLATQAKDLLDKALKINPNNDSSIIGLGACYMLGNISNSPMEGILPVREVARKNPNNLYAHYILGLGGIKSNQLGKAIEHFKVLANADAKNVVYNLHLAECYERMKEKENAIEFYNKTKALLKDSRIIKEIENRIAEISKQ